MRVLPAKDRSDCITRPKRNTSSSVTCYVVCRKLILSTQNHIYAPFVLSTPITFDKKPPAVQYFRGQIAEGLKLYLWLVAEVEGLLVGYAYANTHHSQAALN